MESTRELDRALNRACLAVGVIVITIMLTLFFALAPQARADGYRYPPPPPPAVRYVTHNGSLMAVRDLPNYRIEIRYVEPRPSLWPIGVRPGTLLIHGHWQGPTFYGVAHVFAGACHPFPYPVSGVVRGDVLVLQGPAPIVDPYACIVLGMAWTHNSELVFIPSPS